MRSVQLNHLMTPWKPRIGGGEISSYDVALSASEDTLSVEAKGYGDCNAIGAADGGETISAENDIIYVDVNGDDENEGSIDAPVATITKAVELAQEGSGQIIINEGTYTENTIYITKDLNITGVGDVVIMNVNNLFEVSDLDWDTWEPITINFSISNITFTNCSGINGAILVSAYCNLIFDGCHFISNGITDCSELIQVTYCNLTLTNSVFEDNDCSYRNSKRLISSSWDNLYIDNCNFTNNKYGILELLCSNVTITNSSFIENHAGSESTLIKVEGYPERTFKNRVYSGNIANLIIDGCSFIDNTAEGSPSTYLLDNDNATIGGSIIVSSHNVTISIVDTLFENNIALTGNGGVIYSLAGDITIDKSIFNNNVAETGTAIYMKYVDKYSEIYEYTTPEELSHLNIANSIILGEGSLVICEDTKGTYIANNNWWGTNDEPTDKTTNVTVDTWAKMNATYTPEGAYEGEITITATFDNNKLPDGIEVTFTSTSETLDETILTENAQATVTYTIDTNDKAVYATSGDAVIEMPIVKELENTTLEAAADSVKVGDDVIVNVTFDKNNVTGDVSITIDGTDYTSAVEDGAATIVIPDLSAGEYNVDVVYTGDDNFNAANTTVSFTVDKYAVEFSKAKGHPGRVDKNATVDVILSESDATGTVSIIIDGTEYSAELADGAAVIYAPLLPAGTYNADVVYSGDDKYENNTASVTFNVNKYYPTMKATAASVRVDENATVNVVLPEDATGTVTVTVDGADYTADVVDGTAAVVLPVISEAGSQSFDVVYSGDDKYRTYTTGVTFNVLKNSVVVKATARTVRVGEDVTVNVVLSESDATGTVSIEYEGAVYEAAVEDGAASIVVSDLPIGQYALTVQYSGDAAYKAANATVTFNVNKQNSVLKATARTVKVGDNVTVNVVLSSDATGEVSIDINGTVYTGTVEDGAATIVIPDLAYGQYALEVQYSGDDKYKAKTTTVTFNVNKQSTTMKATARTVKVGENVTVNVKLASDVTGDVVITVDGVDYTATVEDGVATIVLPDLPAGQYSLDVKYSGDDKYKNQSTTVKFNVNKHNVKMRATTKYYSDGDYSIISVTLSDDATGEISTEINGKTYSTNVVEGSCLLGISKLPAGEYSVDIVYNGDAKYNNYTVTKTLNVVK